MSSAGPTAAPPPIGQRIRAPKTAELVAGVLRKRIVRGELSEGEVLPPESVLMEQFHVSRPTLREAFRVLESESLITVRRGAHGGARVQPPREDLAARYAGLILQYRGTSVADVLEVRTIVEPQAVGLLARRRTKADLGRLRDHLAEPGPVAEADTDVLRRLERFHGLLVELTGNQTLRVLLGMIEHIVEQVDLTRVRADEGSAVLATAIRRSGRAHAKVVDLIEARDAAAAEQLWRRHLTAGRDYLLRDGSTTVLDLLS